MSFLQCRVARGKKDKLVLLSTGCLLSLVSPRHHWSGQTQTNLKLYCIERLWKFFENIDIRHIRRSVLLHSCCNVTNSSTHLLGTLRGLLKLSVHKWLLPLLRHGTKEDSLALTLGLGSSVMMPQVAKGRRLRAMSLEWLKWGSRSLLNIEWGHTYFQE